MAHTIKTPKSQDCREHQFFAIDQRGIHGCKRRFNPMHRKLNIACNFVRHQHADFIEKLTKTRGTRMFAPHETEFVLHQGVIYDYGITGHCDLQGTPWYQ